MASDGSRGVWKNPVSGGPSHDEPAHDEPAPEEPPRHDPWAALARANEAAEERKDRVRSRRFLPSEAELLAELEETVQDESPPRPRSRQVGVRLQPAQWKRLLLVAQWSGVRPTTMARILINRGARAVIDEELRHRRQFGPEADG